MSTSDDLLLPLLYSCMSMLRNENKQSVHPTPFFLGHFLLNRGLQCNFLFKEKKKALAESPLPKLFFYFVRVIVVVYVLVSPFSAFTFVVITVVPISKLYGVPALSVVVLLPNFAVIVIVAFVLAVRAAIYTGSAPLIVND